MKSSTPTAFPNFNFGVVYMEVDCMSNILNLVDKKFGELIVLKKIGSDKHGKSTWLCKCNCGNEKNVVGTLLTQGIVINCGCAKNNWKNYHNKNTAITHHITHGMYNTRLYNIWKLMKQRCYNPKATKYNNYGGRGISVCSKWQEFNPFCNWSIHNKYDDCLTLDRININGNYEPRNCRWITNREQQFNKRNSDFIEYNGETKTLTQWAEIIKINPKTLWNRIYNENWDVEKALITPIKSKT